MQPFSYTQATRQSDVIAALQANANAAVIAGGTDLIDLMKVGVSAPDALVDINKVALADIEVANNVITIGALARMSDVGNDARIKKAFPVLSEALLASASGQIRNVATIGGNLMQRTRCPYFRERAFACNKRSPGSGCAAIGGFDRGSAIFGASPKCIAVHPSDMAVALVALGAEIVIANGQGQRRVAVEDFYLLPGDTPERETVLAPGELIVAVSVPSSAMARRSVYLKVRDRASFEFALVSVAAAVELKGATIQAARIALGGVAPRPWRVPAAEDAIVGKPATAANFATAAAAAMSDAVPAKLNTFKIAMAKAAIVRALTTVTGVQ
jgi:xanthine dehydrogenase YagS FAD-binding subunit